MMSLKTFKEKILLENNIDLIKERSLEFFWCFEMKAPKEHVWNYISDTSRLNREIGLEPRQQIEKNGKVFVKTKMAGFQQEWIEEPWFWISGKILSSTRNYLKGFAKQVQSIFYLDAESYTEKRVIYIYFVISPSNILSKIFFKLTGPLLHSRFSNVFKKIDTFFKKNISIIQSYNALEKTHNSLSKDKKEKLEVIRNELISKNLNSDIINKLCDYIERGDEMELDNLRLVALAGRWQVQARELTVIALHATRMGLLNLSWDVICPHCRSSRVQAQSLAEIPDSASCKSCEVDFTTDNKNSIEILFHVHPSIRPIKEILYCSAEPAKKQHIKIQQILKPRNFFEIKVDLKEGNYLVRTTGSNQSCKIEVRNHYDVTQIDFSKKNNQIFFKINPKCTLKFKNDTNHSITFILEELWRDNTALRPAQIFALPEFKDLFSEEHLNSNVKLYLGEQTLLFTDIVGSTKFYKAEGDAKAFSFVRSHFQEVFEEIQNQNGVVVKTIGDAVMGAFASAEDAIMAAIKIQKKFHPSRTDSPIRLRISLHKGTVIAVKLNVGVDYFGSAVNFAAKIQSLAGASEIALSNEILKIYLEKFDQENKFKISKQKANHDYLDFADVFVIDTSIKKQAA